MKTERISRNKTSHIIQSKSEQKGILNIMDNRSDKNHNYLSGIMCQRKVDVVQMAPADNKFVYVPDIRSNTHDNRVPYKSKHIVFTEYNGDEILSAGFSGCFMMSFRFNSDFDRYNQVLGLLTDNDQQINTSKAYIAHVANDAKDVLFDAEARNLIIIEAIFRPYRYGELDNPNRTSSQPNITSPQAGVNNLTGGMKRVENEWISKVYLQEKMFEGDPILNPTQYQWRNQLLDNRSLDPVKLRKETLATKVFIYASICCNDSLNPNLWRIAHHMLLQIINSGVEGFAAFDRAKDLITERGNEKVRKLLNSFMLTKSLF